MGTGVGGGGGNRGGGDRGCRTGNEGRCLKLELDWMDRCEVAVHVMKSGVCSVSYHQSTVWAVYHC